MTTLAGTGKGKAATAKEDVVEKLPFMLLRLDLPPPPLFKDAMQRTVIPQVTPHAQQLHGVPHLLPPGHHCTSCRQPVCHPRKPRCCLTF